MLLMLKRTVALMLCILSVFTLLPAFSSAQTLSGWTSKVDYDNTDPNKYSIEIDLVNQIITVYEGQIGGRIVLQSLCTTGDAEHQTGAGTFKLGDMKERFGTPYYSRKDAPATREEKEKLKKLSPAARV